MSLQSFFGNVTAGISNTVNDALSQAKTRIQGIIGNASAGFTSLWSGGFAGISEAGVGELKTALVNYIGEIEAVIAGFDENGNIENAFKGSIQVAAADYIAAIKNLLEAYVSRMRVNLDDLDAAFTAYMDSTSSLAANISSDAEAVRAEAAGISLD